MGEKSGLCTQKRPPRNQEDARRGTGWGFFAAKKRKRRFREEDGMGEMEGRSDLVLGTKKEEAEETESGRGQWQRQWQLQLQLASTYSVQLPGR
jgi:hypothetical protein